MQLEAIMTHCFLLPAGSAWLQTARRSGPHRRSVLALPWPKRQLHNPL